MRWSCVPFAALMVAAPAVAADGGADPVAVGTCGKYHELHDLIEQHYGLRDLWWGLSDHAPVILQIMEGGDGEWIILVVKTDGEACVANRGGDSQPQVWPPEVPPGRQTPA